ncbi:hypothetical protein HZA76_03295 [Candidatus Roizmanbacteria bacterium]|nr:hypothetical protein [Candidatus Roizmanbacteria bacterium]
MKKILLVLAALMIIFFLGRNLNPFSSVMFTFHDSTQPARVQQFTLNLKYLNIPPRVALDFNYGLGFPVFNFYAPFSYWVTSAINLVGFDIVSSLKFSFLLALLIGFISAYLFLKKFFGFFPSLLGGILYITSLYFPLNIFVRGNLAELWFLSLLPLALLFVYENSQKINIKKLIGTGLVLSFLFTSHNILSLISLPIVIVFLLLLKNKKQNLLSLALAILLSVYFWLPALVEMKYTWAREVATATDFHDHFLCANQLWQSNWGYGGSTVRCVNDGMSFKIGKIQLTLFFLGLLFLLKGKKNKKIHYFFLILSTGSLFLTLYQSRPLWETFSPIMSIIQFPWRFIGISLLGIAFFSAYFFENFTNIPFKNLLIIGVITTVLIINGKYFVGREIKKDRFEKQYLSQEFINNKAAYAVAEYLPKTTDYKYWRSLENKRQIPTEFFARSTLEPFAKNKQTPIEKISSFISLTVFIFLIWKIINK